jgi:hypothetical protein
MRQNIHILTLVDITDTGITRVRDNNTKEYHQQQNLNVLLQTISLRTQPLEPVVKIYPELSPMSALESKFGFGNVFSDDRARVWGLHFYVESEDVWRDGDDPLGLLKKDIHGVAITGDLDNTVDFPVNIFDTQINPNIVSFITL